MIDGTRSDHLNLASKDTVVSIPKDQGALMITPIEEMIGENQILEKRTNLKRGWI